MPTLSVVNFNIVCATLGGFVSIFGLVSFLLKEKFYLSEALISLIAGVIFSPHATNLIRPLEYANGSQINLDTITLYFTRLVLGVQLVLAGVQLPSRYLRTEWKSLTLLLGPGMTGMWVCTSLLIWGLVPNLSFLNALAVAACVTPTDPVLSNSIVKGRFADKNIPRDLQRIIIAESGANDGLGYPFLFLPLYLMQYIGDGGAGQVGGAKVAIGNWFSETWAYTIILSVVYGATVGWISKELLHWAEERKYVDRESFLVFAITLALFITGTCGMIGSDDVLACFIAGNTFTWDDWFRLETLDDSLQPTIDMLLNVAVFMWFGAICPWNMFAHNDVIPVYRLIFLGILVLLFRRLPIVFGMHKHIRQIEGLRQTLFVGFFGPVGVSAVFYLYISLEFLRSLEVDGVQRPDAAQLSEVMLIVVWFIAICSIIVHGLSIPLGKLGLYLPRTISNAVSVDASTIDERDPSVQLQDRRFITRLLLPMRSVRVRQRTAETDDNGDQSKHHLFGIPTPTRLRKGSTSAVRRGSVAGMSISGPQDVRRLGRPTISRSNRSARSTPSGPSTPAHRRSLSGSRAGTNGIAATELSDLSLPQDKQMAIVEPRGSDLEGEPVGASDAVVLPPQPVRRIKFAGDEGEPTSASSREDLASRSGQS